MLNLLESLETARKHGVHNNPMAGLVKFGNDVSTILSEEDNDVFIETANKEQLWVDEPEETDPNDMEYYKSHWADDRI